jgi:hypothetical protein
MTRPSSQRWWLLSVAVLVVAVGIFVSNLRGSDHADAAANFNRIGADLTDVFIFPSSTEPSRVFWPRLSFFLCVTPPLMLLARALHGSIVFRRRWTLRIERRRPNRKLIAFARISCLSSETMTPPTRRPPKYCHNETT